MTENVEELSVGFKDGVSAGVKTATDNVTGLGAAATVAEGNVDRLGQTGKKAGDTLATGMAKGKTSTDEYGASVERVTERVKRHAMTEEQMANALDRSRRLATAAANASRPYIQMLQDLETHSTSAAEKEQNRAKIMAQLELAVERAQARVNNYFDRLEKGANAATAAVGGWASGMSAVYAVAETASNGIYGVAKALQAVDADFRSGHTGFSEWAAAARGLEVSLRGVSAAQRSINDAVGLSRQTANTATIGPTRYATTGAVSGAGTITFGDDGSAQRLEDLNAAFAAGADELDAYRVSLGLVDVAQRKYEAGLVDLESMIRRVGVEEAEANRLRTAYAAANDPAQKRAAETAAENTRLAASYGAVMNALDPAHAAQVRYDKALADLRAGAAAAGRSEAELAADIDRVTAALSPAAIAAKKEEAALQSLLDRADPAAAKMRALSADLALLNAAAAKGDPQVAGRVDDLTAALKRQHGVLDGSASKTKLAAHEMTNLSYQFQDFAVQVGSGQGIFRPFLQQAPQAVGAVGGLERAMALLASPVTLVVLGVAAFVGGLAAIGARAVQIGAQTRELTATMRAYGTESQATAQKLRGVATALYEGGASRAESFSTAKLLASTRGLSASLGREIALLGSDMAAGMGGSVDEMTKQLAGLATQGYPAIMKLQEATGFLNAEEMASVRTMSEHGRQADALGVALGALHRRFDGLRKEGMTPAGVAMHDLGVQFNRMLDEMASSSLIINVEVALSERFKQLADFFEKPGIETFGKLAATGLGAMSLAPGSLKIEPASQADIQADLRRKISQTRSSLQTLEASTYVDPVTSLEINRKRDDIASLERRLAAITRTIATTKGGIPSVRAANDLPDLASVPAAVSSVNPKAVEYVDAQTHAYDRLSQSLQGNAVQRQLAAAAMKAEDEIRDNNLSGAQAEAIQLLRLREALLQMSVAVADANRAAAAEIAGADLVARAYGVSALAVRDATVQQKALVEVARGSIESYDVIVARLRAVDDAQRAVNAAMADFDLRNQIADATALARAESVSGAAVAEAALQNRIRNQVVKEGVAADSARAQAIDAGTRALEAQNSAAKVNASIRQQNQDLSVARAEYEMLGLSNAEREKQVAILKATLDVQNSGDWQKAPQETRDAWVAQAGAVAEYKARVADATETSRDFANTITKGFEDATLSGGKLGDTVKALVKDIERIALRSTVTKPLENWLTGTMTKALSPTPVNDNAVQPVNDNDPGGWKAKFDAWTSSGAGTLGASSSNAMWVQLAGGGAALAARATAGGLPMPVAIKDAGDIASLVRSEARAQGVPEEVAVAIAKIESNFRQYRDDGRLLTSSAGAQGVMQLMPDTAKWLGVDASDTRENVRGGVKYLAMLGRQFGGDWSAVAGAYNAGPGRMTTNLNHGQALPAETVTYIQKFGTSVNAANAAVVSLRAPVVGVTAAQEAQLQQQLDAVPALKAANDSTQALTATQQGWVDSALGVTSANSDAASSIAVTARAMDKIGPNAISAADGLKQGATGAAALGDAASDGADTLLGSLKNLSTDVGDWFDGLFGGGKPSQRKVVQNADGSTSMAPAAQGAGGSWLSRPAYSWSTGQASGKGGENAATGEIAAGVESVSWGRVLAGIGGVAAGITTATQKGATAGQKIGGGLTAAGGAVMLVPGGQVVGGVMMAAGALLAAVTGAKDRGTAYSRSNITLGANGKYALGSYAADNNGDPTKFNADAAKIAKGLNDIAARLNLTATASNSFIDTKEKSAEQAALELLKGMQSAVPNVAYALAHETATSLDDALSHLEFASGFDQQLAGLRSSVSDLFTDFKTGVDSANSFAKSLLDVIDNAQTVFAVPKGASLPGFATGTLSAPSGYAIVGEEGPEVVRLAGGERIWNARESAQLVARLGRGRDDTLIHLRGSDELSAVRRALGSPGRINPATGLLGFDDGDAASGHGGENAAHGETNSSTAGRDSAYGGGWGGSSGGSGGALDSIASSVSDLTAAVADSLASYAGWKADTEANTQAQTSVVTAVAGLSTTAVAASLSAVASTLGPAISGMIEGVTGVKGSAAAVSHDYGDMGAGGVTGGASTGGTIGERAAQADRGGSYAGVSAQQIDQTLAALAAAIKSDPSFSAALVGSMRVGGTATNGVVGPTVKEIADTQGATLGYFGGDPAQVLQQLDDAAQQLLAATGAIPEVLQRALDGANSLAPLIGATSATSTRQAQEQAAQQQATALQSQFDGVGLARSRVSELNDIVKSLGENTFNPIGKDFDALATDMAAAAKAYTAAGQSVPDGLFAAQRQMVALGAARKRLLDEVAGVTVETSPEQKKVEQIKGAWSATATDLVKAFAAVGIVGDELAARLNEGLTNALIKERDVYGKSLDAQLRKVRGEDGYDSAVALADSYKTALSDVNALWTAGADRARETAVVTATLNESLLALVKSGGVTSKSLTELQAVYADQPTVLAAVTAALGDLTAAAARQQASTLRSARTTFEEAVNPNYRVPVTAEALLGGAGVTTDLGGFASELDRFGAALARGSAVAGQARAVFDALTERYQAGTLTAEQYSSLVQSVSQSWQSAQQAAQALASYQGDITARMYGAVGASRTSGLLALDQQQASELAQARANGYDTGQLQQVQAVERGQKAFELAQADVLGWYDKEIAAKSDLVSSLQDGAVKIVQIARQFQQAGDSLRLSEDAPISPQERLAEAVRQWNTALGTVHSTTATDGEKETARSLLTSLGSTLVSIEKTNSAGTARTLYDEVLKVFGELGDTSSLGVDTAEQQLQTASDQLKELQRARADAAALGQKQYGALGTLNATMQQSFVLWQDKLLPLLTATGTTSNVAHYSAPAAVQAAWDGMGVGQRQALAQSVGWTQSDLGSAFNSYVASSAGRISTFEANSLALSGGQHYAANDNVGGAWAGLSDAQRAAALRSAGWLGTVSDGYAGANAWVSLGNQAAFEKALLAQAHAAGVPGYATGTLSTPPGAIWVGERGPELMWQGGGAAVASSTDSLRIAGLWQAANDRWGAENVTSFRPPQPVRPNSDGAGSAAILAELRRLNAQIAALIQGQHDAEGDAQDQRGVLLTRLIKAVQDLKNELADLKPARAA